ncbi:MAG: hypothetical protein J6X69_04110 [Bacteroidales bacterium]|nr:hypothetical protein [Bacteroidales bacterium]
MRIRRLSIPILAAILFLSGVSGSCTTDKKVEYAKGDGSGQEEILPLVPEGGVARFILRTDRESLRHKVGSGSHTFSSEDEIYLKSAVYHPVVTEDGTVYLEVPESVAGTYRMFCYPQGSKFWFLPDANYPVKDLIIPYSQFYGKTAQELASYPMYAEYSEATGARMDFREVISALEITLKGSARIASVHVENKATGQSIANNLAGLASYTVENGYVLDEGVNFVNLNCTNDGEGVPITPAGERFYLVLSKGEYASGLTLTVTDMDHKGQVFDIPALQLAAGEIKPFTFQYAPPADLLFFEHFDNFVWGGHVKGNSALSAYAPSSSVNLNDDPTGRKGNENAFVKVTNETPGSAFIQANWTTVSGWTVGERPNVSKEYVRSRNIGSYAYMYRCQEYQGCVSCGGGDQVRGVIQPFKSLSQFKDGYYDLNVSFDICFRYGTDDDFCTRLTDSGIVTSATIDGIPLELDHSIGGNNTYNHSFVNVCLMDRQTLSPPSNENYTDGWHHVELTCANLNDASAFALWGVELGANIIHGHFIDNLEIRAVKHPAPAKRLRVLLYNIQNGMWADQGNDFDNFVAWLNRYDPDVCVFCEAQSIYKTGTSTADSQSNYKLFKNGSKSNTETTAGYADPQWNDLARRFHHDYSAVSGWRDNYPQVITSKYPITTLRRITTGTVSDQYVMHGAGHFQITVDGQRINIVTCHLWPQLYWPGRNTEESRANQEGRDYQKYEAQSIMIKTVQAYPEEENWLLMGDTNSISPLDEPYYDEQGVYQTTKVKWMYANEEFRSPSYGRQLVDMVREAPGSPYTGPGRFITSTGGTGRIDIMYGSESMARRVTTLSTTIKDTWSNVTSSVIYDPEQDSQHFSYPSDHRPIFVEFDMSR